MSEKSESSLVEENILGGGVGKGFLKVGSIGINLEVKSSESCDCSRSFTLIFVDKKVGAGFVS